MFSVLTSLHSVQNVTLSAQNVTLSAQNVTLSAQNVTLSAQNVTLSAQNVILLIIGRYYKTLSTKSSVGPLPITHLEVLSVKSNPRICTLRTSLFIMTSKRKTSEVWTYFSVDQDTPVFAQCLLCDMRLKRGKGPCRLYDILVINSISRVILLFKFKN